MNSYNDTDNESNNRLPVIKFKLGNQPVRYLTVINGLPFYCSSGKNSTYPNTWFVCRGISSKNWIRKSSAHPDFINFCVANKIPTEHIQSRLGSTMEVVCISASIGGGFWDTVRGQIIIKELLLKKYKYYFLDQEIVRQLLEDKQRKGQFIGSDVLLTSKAVNKKLLELGVILLLEKHNNQLPRDSERQFLYREKIKMCAEEVMREMYVMSVSVDEPPLPIVDKHAYKDHNFFKISDSDRDIDRDIDRDRDRDIDRKSEYLSSQC